MNKILAPFVGLALCGAAVACDGLLDVDFDNARAAGADASADSPDGAVPPPPAVEPDVPLVPASQVDLLLVVDNSASMGDKSNLLASSIGTLIREVAKVGDVHVGVISSSLGNFGGDVCDPNNPRANDRAHLRTTASTGDPVAAATAGFLSYQGGDTTSLVKDTETLVRGVGETGCGLEAQLEATYRFLVQPDPSTDVTLDSFNQADFSKTIDGTVLKQRKAFLRPNSALVVVMITDEDDSSVDPLSVGGQGWAFMAKNFPGSRVFRGSAAQGTTAPRGTSTCSTDPASPDCSSCGYQSLCDAADPACQKIKADPRCTSSAVAEQGEGYNGYHGPTDDELNVRFHRMKQRFGIDPQYPIARYTDGFTRFKVPNRAAEHEIKLLSGGRREIAPYTGALTCTNPIFAASLPSDATGELCNLPPGTRSRELVVFALLGGVPEQLATDQPNWQAILGTDPAAFNFAGIDPHMIPSTEPRAGLPAPSSTLGDNGPDPVHGREWATNKSDLQYACTFPLATARQCSANSPSCDCYPGATSFPPLCGATVGMQVRGKAYPTTRPLRVVQSLGQRGVLGSICASSGYDATMQALATRLKPRLAL
jgi:hypothetical protein